MLNMHMTSQTVNNILKWIATSILCLGSYIVSAHPMSYPLGPLVLFCGGFVWLIVAVRWRERALIITNGVMCLITVVGLLRFYEYI